MMNEHTPIGKIALDGNDIFIRPTADTLVHKAIEGMLATFSVVPKYVLPQQGGEVPASLAQDFPNDDPKAFVYKFSAQPLIARGDSGTRLDPRKAKTHFAGVDGQDITFGQLGSLLLQSMETRLKSPPTHSY